MAKPYKNAAAIFPKKLLLEIQRYHHGLLWIPKSDSFYQERQNLIGKLKADGVATNEIAKICELSKSRVRQILQGLAGGDKRS